MGSVDKLSRVEIQKYQGTPKDVFLWETTSGGFGVKITPKERVSFVLTYWTKKRVKKRFTIKPSFKIQTINNFVIDEARKQALALRVGIMNGAYPHELLAKERNKVSLFKELVELYRENHLTKKNSSTTVKSYDGYLVRLQYLYNKEIENFIQGDVEYIKAKFEKESGKRTANVVLTMLKTIFSYGLNRGMVALNPCKGVDLFPEEARDRVYTLEEVKKIYVAASDDNNDVFGKLVQLYFLTGCRKTELVMAKHSDLVGRRLVLTAENTKTKTERPVLLSNLALEIITSLPKIKDNPYLFPGKGNGPFNGFSNGWKRIKERSGVKDAIIHDIRRSCGTRLEEVGVSENRIKRVLGHSISDVTQKHYIHPSDEELIVVMSHLEKWIKDAIAF